MITEVRRIPGLDGGQHFGGEITEYFRVGGGEVECDAFICRELFNISFHQRLGFSKIFCLLYDGERASIAYRQWSWCGSGGWCGGGSLGHCHSTSRSNQTGGCASSGTKEIPT